MATNYPTSIDTFVNPTSNDQMTNPPHSGQHTDANDAIVAVQAELGANPSGISVTVASRLSGLDSSVSSINLDVSTLQTDVTNVELSVSDIDLELTGINTELGSLDQRVTTLESEPGGGADIPAGIISLWSGAANAIPTGWRLCDGLNGTPDLRSRFVVGASASGGYAVGASGGADDVTLTAAQLPSHNHDAGTLAAGAHTHAAGNISADSHSHASGTLTGLSHTHNSGNYAGGSHTHGGPSHSHGSGNYAAGSGGAHTHTAHVPGRTTNNHIAGTDLLAGTSSGTGSFNKAITAQLNGNHTHSVGGNSSTASGNTGSSTTTVAGNSGATTPGVSGSTAATTPGVTGETASASPSVSGATATAGSGNSHENRPPYYALCYIMKD